MRLSVEAQNWTHRKATGNLIRTVILLQDLRPDEPVERGSLPLLLLANTLYRHYFREPPAKWLESFEVANAA